MIIDCVQERNDRVVGVWPLNLLRMPLIKTKLTISGCVMRMIFTALVILVLHEVQVSVETVEGVFEEECYQAICPSISSKQIQDSQFGTTISDPCQELKLECCFAVQLALDIVLQNQLGQFVELSTLWMNVPEEDKKVHSNPSSIWSVVDISLAKVSGEQRLFVSLIKTRNFGSSWHNFILGLFLDKVL